MSARFSYLSHLECSHCHRQYDADQLHNASPCCVRPLLAMYDLTSLARDLAPGEIAGREATMWRYHELLPVREARSVLTLGEGITPLLAAPRLAPVGLERRARLLVKDEGQNPTGSFKARGMAAALSRAVACSGLSGTWKCKDSVENLRPCADWGLFVIFGELAYVANTRRKFHCEKIPTHT